MDTGPHAETYSGIEWVNAAMRGMYPGRARFLSGLGLEPVVDEIAAKLPIVGLVGDPNWRDASHVIASPCIDHCGGELTELTASVAGDLLLGLRVAEVLNRPLISYLGSGEEIFLVPGGQPRAAKWREIATWVDDLAASWVGSRVASHRFATHEASIWGRIQSQVEADREALPDSTLNGLHRLSDDLPYPGGTRFTYLYEYYRSNIGHYRKNVLESLTGERVTHVLVVENVQQIKCNRLCAALNFTDGIRMSHLVTCPVPDLTSKVRVTRADRGNRVMMTDLLAGDVPQHSGFWPFLVELNRSYSGADAPAPKEPAEVRPPRPTMRG
ncbi:hypothetical protein E0F15_11060 [Frankia sp. B2]|uniref:hypothetical protein n=1 Tax=Frankia sp. B2 TaxID=2541730 RepID=UPI001068EFDB|nr:hypothetical protein [Frankia sp. B2]TFE31018.1 hypothetical protein E0F15_11060 [Frankia sp. B2]